MARARALAALLLVLFVRPSVAHAERVRAASAGATIVQREARERLRDGDRLMREEQYREAIAAYQAALALDPMVFMAHYGIGRAHMALRDYESAIASYLAARSAFHALQAAGGDARQLGLQTREDQIRAVQDAMRDLESQLRLVSPNSRTGRRLNDQMRLLDGQLDVLEQVKAAEKAGGPSRIPPGLLLALGSAYFRAGRLEDAEREYKAAIAADAKLAEARNNLAVVYLETGRGTDAQREIELAEKFGFRVHPELKRAVSRALN